MADKSTAVTQTMMDQGNATLGASAVLEVYEGSLPATADTSNVADAKLAQFDLQATPFASATDQGTQVDATANFVSTSTSALADGTAGYYRIAGAADQNTGTYQGTAGQTAEELVFDNATFQTGGVVTITSFKLTLAK